VLDLAIAGQSARMNWEHRAFEPVELTAEPPDCGPRTARRLDHASGTTTASGCSGMRPGRDRLRPGVVLVDVVRSTSSKRHSGHVVILDATTFI